MGRIASSLCLALACLLWPGPGAHADEPDPPPSAPAKVSDGAARKLVGAFDSAVKRARKEKRETLRREEEAAALRALASGAHGRVVKRLAEAAADDRLFAATREAALRALVLQGEAARGEGPRIAKWLGREADGESERLRRGDCGLPVDRRTGDPVTTTPEAQRALLEAEERARLLAAGLATLRELGHEPKQAETVLAPLLQSPHDDLCIAAIDAARAWDVRALAPRLALLLRMYPRPNRWETGAVTHLGGTNASAKAAWMTLFGHPLKQRARPLVHNAVVACLSAWAGRKIADPETCDAWLRTLD